MRILSSLLLAVILGVAVHAEERRVLTILVNFEDKQEQPYTVGQAQGTMAQVDAFYRENSYEQMTVAGDISGWYTIPMSYTVCDRPAIETYALQAAANAGVDLSAYGHYVFAFPANACTFSGHSTIGGNPSRTWIRNTFLIDIVGHELGHAFGMVHSGYMDCGLAVIGNTCTTNEYGDWIDTMGSSAYAHVNLYHKEQMGWTVPQTVTTSGTYWIDAYEPISTGVKGLKIFKSVDLLTGLRSWYYIEKRTAYGFDSFLSINQNVLNGVLVRIGKDPNHAPFRTNLLDMTPTDEPNSWFDPALMVGQSFADSEAGVTVTTLSADSTGASVRVDLTPSPSPTPVPTPVCLKFNPKGKCTQWGN